MNLSFSTARYLPTIGFLSSRTRSRGNTPRFGMIMKQSNSS
nr:MAG TPA: hypothetical protein [Caudoviricetes sp.]